jgi:predicted nicotinamide N-methyase
MAKRAYNRNRRGQFAPRGSGRVTFGNAGGFANANHRLAVQHKMVTRARRRRVLRIAAEAAGTAAAAGLAGAIASRSVKRPGVAFEAGRFIAKAIIKAPVS